MRSLYFALNTLESIWGLQCSPRDMTVVVEVKFRQGEGLPAVRKWWGIMRGSPAIDLRQELRSEVVGGGSSVYRARAVGRANGGGTSATRGHAVAPIAQQIGRRARDERDGEAKHLGQLG